ncbi:hypothetical protein NDU88_004585 [Pleurodeles waltl]|uniref:Uncharacterized protein n=1 Tax=Pleurodeles waltl TaxID=8319 RepID=A0AAV7QD15_PLEWA|nr:hypothetical protein NDU88_004585 [Pleurodeles waltl]
MEAAARVKSPGPPRMGHDPAAEGEGSGWGEDLHVSGPPQSENCGLWPIYMVTCDFTWGGETCERPGERGTDAITLLDIEKVPNGSHDGAHP